MIRTPACWARCRRRRVAACRSTRVPPLLSRIGPPVRSAMARSMARPTAGGSGIRMTLVPLPHTRKTRWPCSSPRSPMSAPVASKIRQAQRPEHGHQGEAVIAGRLARGGQQRLELKVSEPERWRFGRDMGPADMLGRGVLQYAVEDASAAEETWIGSLQRIMTRRCARFSGMQASIRAWCSCRELRLVLRTSGNDEYLGVQLSRVNSQPGP